MEYDVYYRCLCYIFNEAYFPSLFAVFLTKCRYLPWLTPPDGGHIGCGMWQGLSVFCACTHFGEQIRPTENPYEPVRGERCASQPVQDGVQTLKLSAVNVRGTDTISMRSRYRRTQLALVPKKLWTYETRKFA